MRQLFFTSGWKKQLFIGCVSDTFVTSVRSADAATIFFRQIASNAPWASTSPVSHPENGTRGRNVYVCVRARTCGVLGAACCCGALAQTLATFIYLLFFFRCWVGGGGVSAPHSPGPSGFTAYATCAPPPTDSLHTSYVLWANLFQLRLLFNSAPPFARKEAPQRCRRRFRYICLKRGTDFAPVKWDLHILKVALLKGARTAPLLSACAAKPNWTRMIIISSSALAANKPKTWKEYQTATRK